jgi:RHS repeat-associated protein
MRRRQILDLSRLNALKHDLANRCVGYDNPRTTWTYTAGGWNLAQFNSNGTRTSYSYDNANRLTRVSNFTNPTSLMSDYAVKYDKAGNRTRVTNNVSGLVTTYLYDKAYQLTADYTSVDRNTYVYDLVGNRQVFRRADGSVATYTYDVANQMTRILDAGIPTTLTYDQAGNPLQQRNTVQPFNVTMVWDAESRMTDYHQTGISGGNSFNQQLTHEYNGDGQRVVRQSGVAVAQYVWNGQNVCLKLDGGGSIDDQYHYQPQVYGRLFASSSYWHHYDPLGSTTNLTSSSGIQAVYRYGVWGDIDYVFTSGSVVDPFLFVGEQGYYTDDEGIDKNDTSPLLPYYVRARFYNPAWGRWLNRDPIGFAGGDSNFYRYASNQPTGVVDASGMLASDKQYADCIKKFAPTKVNDSKFKDFAKCLEMAYLKGKDPNEAMKNCAKGGSKDFVLDVMCCAYVQKEKSGKLLDPCECANAGPCHDPWDCGKWEGKGDPTDCQRCCDFQICKDSFKEKSFTDVFKSIENGGAKMTNGCYAICTGGKKPQLPKNPLK